MNAVALNESGPFLTSGAEVIVDWNKTAADYLMQGNYDFAYFRAMTMVHVAQFDAVNAVYGGYTPYALSISAPGASPVAAAAQAAYSVLTNVSKLNLPTLNAALQKSLATVPDGAAKTNGIQLGRAAANLIIQLRGADNPNLPIIPPTTTIVGKWRISPPNSPPGVGAHARYMLPWSMRSMSQFRPGPPPAVSSDRYAADFDEVRTLGARSGGSRTEDQANAAKFHDGNDLAYLRPALARSKMPLVDLARVVALYYLAWADANCAFLEAQYYYSGWRPYTAIRLADTDGNDATKADLAWNPFLDTPNHPEYPSGTCAGTSASAEILKAFFGDDYAFSGVIAGRPTRNFTNLSAAVDEAVVARIAAGGHFRFSCLAGVELGKNIARNALANYLRPVPQLSAASADTGVFQLNLITGPVNGVVVETSQDLALWSPWQTNAYGVLLLKDPSPQGTDHRFYRALPRVP